MAKICTECGLKHDSKAQKCVNCGAVLQIIQKDVNRKRIIIISLVAIVLIVATVLTVSYLSTPEAKVKSIMRSFQNNDVDAVVETFPAFIRNFYDEKGIDTDDIFYEWVNGLSDYIFSYNIDKVASPSTNQKNTILSTFYLYSDYGYDPDDIEDIKLVWLKMRGGTPGLWGSSNNRFVMIKQEGKWYWWPFTLE